MIIYTKDENLTKDDMLFYTSINKNRGLIPTGETIKKWCDTGSETKVVFKGNNTPFGFIRDCGDYYIEARYSGYVKLSKDLKIIAIDVDDK